MIDFSVVEGFDWDAGNARKNEKHGVSQAEAEQVFFDLGAKLLADQSHSMVEARVLAFGATEEGRCLTVAFTLRDKGKGKGKRIRVISARDMNRKERKQYEIKD